MATSRSRGSKRGKKRRQKRNSRIPALFLIAAMAGVGGLLVVSAQQPDTPTSAVVESPATEVGGDSTPTQPMAPSTDTPVVTIGSVAPPVTVDTGDDNGDGDEGLVLDDFTPTETPQAPSTPLTVPTNAITDGQVTRSLADGYYLGFLDGVGTSKSILVRFDSANGPLFEAQIENLLFVSLRVDARDPSHPGSAVISARTLNQLLAQGDPTYTIPDTDDLVLVDGTFLVTIVDSRVVGIEALA